MLMPTGDWQGKLELCLPLIVGVMLRLYASFVFLHITRISGVDFEHVNYRIFSILLSLSMLMWVSHVIPVYKLLIFIYFYFIYFVC